MFLCCVLNAAYSRVSLVLRVQLSVIAHAAVLLSLLQPCCYVCSAASLLACHELLTPHEAEVHDASPP